MCIVQRNRNSADMHGHVLHITFLLAKCIITKHHILCMQLTIIQKQQCIVVGQSDPEKRALHVYSPGDAVAWHVREL